MGRRGIAAAAATAVLLSMVGEAGARRYEPEGCEAVNPGQPTCTFTVTETMEGPVTGVAGQGTWLVKVKRGKKTLKIKSPANGAPTAVTFTYIAGDKVTATAISPGAGLIAGGD
jgi:hypothetical protein